MIIAPNRLSQLVYTRTAGQSTHTYKQQEYQGREAARKFEPDTVAVIMSFGGPDSDAAYAAIVQGCREAGLVARRSDQDPGSGAVMRIVYELIEQAEFVVCDLTGERPNVYYELGYAHGAGNAGDNILVVAREGTALHFDIRGVQVRHYLAPGDLHGLVGRQLSAMKQAGGAGLWERPDALGTPLGGSAVAPVYGGSLPEDLRMDPDEATPDEPAQTSQAALHRTGNDAGESL